MLYFVVCNLATFPLLIAQRPYFISVARSIPSNGPFKRCEIKKAIFPCVRNCRVSAWRTRFRNTSKKSSRIFFPGKLKNPHVFFFLRKIKKICARLFILFICFTSVYFFRFHFHFSNYNVATTASRVHAESGRNVLKHGICRYQRWYNDLPWSYIY